MYHEYYGLREGPFDLSSNPKYVLLTPGHQEALSSLQYGISTGNGITLLLGDAGTGKTTLLRRLLSLHRHPSVTPRVRWVHLINPRLSQAEFLESVGHALELGMSARSKSRFLRELENDLTRHDEKGVLTVIVSDEAQSLPDDLLEEIRLLANIETDNRKLLRVVLAGHPVLGARLNQHRFRQLKQRITVRCVLPPLDLRGTAVYIAHRLLLAGGDPARVFSRDAVLAIHDGSRGIPRIINVICENALLTGFAADERPVGAALVLGVCRELDLDATVADGSEPGHMLQLRPTEAPTAARQRAPASDVGAAARMSPAGVRSFSYAAWSRS